MLKIFISFKYFRSFLKPPPLGKGKIISFSKNVRCSFPLFSELFVYTLQANRFLLVVCPQFGALFYPSCTSALGTARLISHSVNFRRFRELTAFTVCRDGTTGMSHRSHKFAPAGPLVYTDPGALFLHLSKETQGVNR